MPLIMKSVAAFAGALVMLLAAGAGSYAGDPPLCDIREFGLDADKFYLYLTQDTPYTGWKLWPGTGTMRSAKSPHGPLVSTYTNPAAYESLAAGRELQPGSLIVMENRGPDGSIRGLSVRLKIRGYHDAGSDWYWLEYDAQGKATSGGRGYECLACHGQGKGDDKTGTVLP